MLLIFSTICSIFVLLLAVGTALDILYIQQPKWRMADKAACTSENDDTLVETENQPLLEKREDIAAVVVPEIGQFLSLVETEALVCDILPPITVELITPQVLRNCHLTPRW